MVEDSELDLATLDINSITDVNEIKRLHGLLQKQEQKVDGELDTILDHHHEINTRIVSVQRLLPNLGILSKEASQLTDVISKTSTLAEKVSNSISSYYDDSSFRLTHWQVKLATVNF